MSLRTPAPARRRRLVYMGRHPGAARGATALSGGAVRKGGGWLWPVLALLALGALLLAGLTLGGSNDDAATTSRDGGAAQQQQQQQAQQPASDSGAAGTGGAAAVAPGQLGIDGRGVDTGSSLTQYVGQQAEGRGLEVQQVDPGAGFFVGGGKGERTFVEWGPKAGTDEATTMPEVGDRVDLTGPVAEAPRQPGRTFGVPVASERVILKQGAYVNADTVRPAS